MITKFVNEPELDFSSPANKDAMEKAIQSILKDQNYPLYIDGEKNDAEKKIKSVNPCKKGEVIGYAAAADRAMAEKAILSAAEAYEVWRFVDPDIRIDYVQKLVGVIKKNRLLIDAWLVLESGKNWGEADGEVCEAIDFINAYCIEAAALKAGVPLSENLVENNRCQYTPIGVGVIIPPWNFPFSILVGMAISAVVTGNTVVIKPASDTPIIGCQFGALCEEVGFPKGVVNVLPGSGGEIGDFIVQHPQTRFINFTGSMEVGLRISRLAAETSPGQKWIKRVVAEMGGKNAIIVDSSADLDKAADGIVASAFGYQGQKCSACSRVIALEDIHDTLIQKIRERTEALSIGEGKDNHAVNAVISASAFRKITEYIETGKKECRLLTGGTYDDSDGFYIKPTVFVDVDPDAHVIAKEEIFGPVVAVMKAKTFDDALRIANDTDYGLTGAVYTQDRGHINLAKKLFHVGNLYFNRKCTGAVVGHHPFGGYNMSGTTAKTGIRDYLYNFVQLKSVSEEL